MVHCMMVSKWRRLALYILFQKRLIFSLLIINLLFFVSMYFIASWMEEGFGKGDEGYNPQQIAVRNEAVSRVIRKPVGVIDHYQNNCSRLGRPDIGLTETYAWYKVSSRTFIYSAYFDNRQSMDVVLIWGISAGNEGKRSKRYCQMWYDDNQLPVILWADYEIIPETHGLRYAPAMFICRVTRPEPPYAVSLVTSKCAEPSHVLPVHAPPPPGRQRRQRDSFTVCVSPLNRHYDDVTSFVEVVEANRILGADKIVFYNHTTGTRLDRYLDHYVSSGGGGLVDVIAWRLPVAVEPDWPDPRVAPEIHYFGQVVALNECLYRYMYRTDYLVFTDLDELIVPRRHRSWAEMMRHLVGRTRSGSGRDRSVRGGAFLFRNVFFRLDWPDAPGVQTIDRRLGLRTLSKLRRESDVWPYYQRTKYILVPSLVLQVGIHYVFEFVHGGRGHDEVPADVALLHHYREWSENKDKALGVVDDVMLRFADQLRQAARSVHRKVGLIDWDD